MPRLLVLIFLGLFLLWFWAVRRAARLFVLRIREGVVVSAAGRLPPRLLSEIADIVERSGVVRARITGVVREGRPVLLFEGELSPAAQQQVRNVVGQFSAADIRRGRPGRH